MDVERLRREVRHYLDEERYIHSLGVMECAGELAKKYNGDVLKAQIAGLVHDCAKSLRYDEALDLCNKYRVYLDDISLKEEQLIHGPLGAKMAEVVFKIEDKEILSAIECHTTGKKGMGLLDKIIYLADYIEPNRNFPGVERIRNLAKHNLDAAVLEALENTIRYVLGLHRLLHPRTVEARNDLVLRVYSKYAE